MTRTGGVPRLMAHAPEPVLAVHPEDARGIADGALARIAGPHGEAVLRLRHDTGQRRGTAFAPMHWTAQNAPTARVNSTVPPAADPVSGQPALKSARVALSAFEPAWHAFLLARRDLGPDLAPYCATGLAAPGVWRHELAGTEEPKQAFARLLALAGEPSGRRRLGAPGRRGERAAPRRAARRPGVRPRRSSSARTTACRRATGSRRSSRPIATTRRRRSPPCSPGAR